MITGYHCIYNGKIAFVFDKDDLILYNDKSGANRCDKFDFEMKPLGICKSHYKIIKRGTAALFGTGILYVNIIDQEAMTLIKLKYNEIF